MNYLDNTEKEWKQDIYKMRLKENAAKVEREIWEKIMPKIERKYALQKTLLLQQQEKEKIKNTIRDILGLLFSSDFCVYSNTLINIYHIAKNNGCTPDEIKSLSTVEKWIIHCNWMVEGR